MGFPTQGIANRRQTGEGRERDGKNLFYFSRFCVIIAYVNDRSRDLY